MTTLELGDRTVEVSNEDKVLFPDEGITKGELVEDSLRVAEPILPHVRDRPLVMRRFPDGIAQDGFYQKEVPEHFPSWIRTVRLEKEEGGVVTHVVCDDAATLVYVANQGTVELHTLLAPVGHPRRPDQLVLDLDPPTEDPGPAVEGVRVVRAVLRELDVTGFVKSTGSRGVHVLVPLGGGEDFSEARTVARRLADAVVARDPDRFTTQHRKEARHGRLFVDWLRNGYGQHAVAPYSPRALPGAPVAVPLDWDEATSSSFDPRQHGLRGVFRRLAQKQDPWADLERRRIPLADLGARLGSLRPRR